MFSKRLEIAISKSYKSARESRHEFLTVEHLALALIKLDTVTDALKQCGADMETLTESLVGVIESKVPKLSADSESDTQPTLAFQRVLQRAVYRVQSSGEKEVSAIHVFRALYGERDSHVVYFLNEQGVDRDVFNNQLHHFASADADSDNRIQTGSRSEAYIAHGISGPVENDRISELEARLREVESRLAEIEQKLSSRPPR